MDSYCEIIEKLGPAVSILFCPQYRGGNFAQLREYLNSVESMVSNDGYYCFEYNREIATYLRLKFNIQLAPHNTEEAIKLWKFFTGPL